MKGSAILHIGIDDTDSVFGMCTTFLGYMIADMLKSRGAEFLDFPRLVRLNPNIPWKTRGNGAVSMKVRVADAGMAKSRVRAMVERYSDTKNGANPGLVFLEADEIPDDLRRFSGAALWQLVRRGSARQLAERHGLDFFYRGNGQGLVGAIGAIGYAFEDHTLELLCYRRRQNFGKKRMIPIGSVQAMQEQNPGTFNSFDARKRRALIAPHGPDPVFYGIRGEDVRSLVRAAGMLHTAEAPDGYMIFKSNQGTADHLRNALDPADLKPHWSGHIEGMVSDMPCMVRGGHVFFTVSSGGCEFRCAIYRPTGMARHAMGLIPGDRISVGGGIRRATSRFPRVLNVEFLHVLHLGDHTTLANPVCDTCSKSMKSKGVGQGYKCARCKTFAPGRQTIRIKRTIEERLYLPTVSAHRHLTRPVQRLGRTNRAQFAESLPWLCRYKVE